jgi:pimeloyl-ACP methyl ester carboxylesterase
MNKLEPVQLSDNGPLLVFAHANGYPPRAYSAFLEPFLKEYQVISVYLRSFWPNSDPQEMRDWRTFRDDYLPQVKSLADQYRKMAPPTGKVIGVGHSLGAMTSLMAAIQDPEMFNLLVLIEPVLFSRWRGFMMRLLAPFKVIKMIHPLIKGTLKRKTHFESREAMYQNYRVKPVFSRLSDRVLRDYVSGLAEEDPQGGVSIIYPPAWEARIYETGGIADRYVWRNLDRVRCPVLVIRGEDTYTLFDRVIERMVGKMLAGEGFTMPGTGHLVSLEKPQETAVVVKEFLDRHSVSSDRKI